MNRQIKFRAWDIDKMVYQVLKDEHNIYSLEKFLEKLNGDAILMQFTGLTDKNGKEIYESDIYNGKYIVFFKYGCWCGGVTFEKATPLFVQVDEDVAEYVIPDWIEITSNIYENPELL